MQHVSISQKTTPVAEAGLKIGFSSDKLLFKLRFREVSGFGLSAIFFWRISTRLTPPCSTGGEGARLKLNIKQVKLAPREYGRRIKKENMYGREAQRKLRHTYEPDANPYFLYALTPKTET